MSDDPLDELGRRLFTVAHTERPSPALRERLLASHQALGSGAAQKSRDSEQAGRSERARPSLGRWLLLAALVAGLALALPRVLHRAPNPEKPLISAEYRKERAASPIEHAQTLGPSEPADSSEAATLRDRVPKAAPTPPNSQPGPSRLARTREAPAAPSPTRAALAEQLEWLKQARVALRSGDSVRALELLETYESKRAGADLQDEANLLRIEALAAMGRQAEATLLAERLVRENPNSPLVDRARSFIRDAASESHRNAPP